jgi:hypothetical protein
MTISSLLSSEPIQGHFAAVEITDADFDRIETIGHLIRHIEIVMKIDDNMKKVACPSVRDTRASPLAYLATK